MNKSVKSIVGAGAVAVVLAACGSSGGGSTSGAAPSSADLSKVKYEGTVSVITRYAGDNAAFFERMKKDYEAAHPGVTVDLQQESDQGYKDKIKTLIASQSVPDVYFSWAGDYAEQFYDNGVALDLTNVIGPSTPWGSTMAPQALNAFAKDGKNFGVPLGLDAKYVLYNKALFAKAGVSVPQDLAGLLSACQSLKAKGVVPMAFGNKDGWPAIHYITQLNSYNVPPETLDKDYNPSTASWADPGYQKSLNQFKQILDQCTDTGKGANGADYYSERDSFGQGKAAMFYVESLEFAATAPKASQADKDGYDLFRLPAAADARGDRKALTGAPDGFLVNPKAKNVPLAVDFLKFATSKKSAQTLTTTIGFPSPVTGTLTAANSTPQLRKSIKDLQSASRLSIWLDTVTAPDVAQAYLSGVQGLVTGDKSADQVMSSVKSASEQAR
jgi:raffinose/stachyose/melibiose transport system substrate-binding protein